MSIFCDKGAKKLWASQEMYIEKVFERFNMKDVKSMSVPLGSHFKLTKSELSENEKEKIEKVPYTLAAGSLMYVMMYTRPDIVYVVGVVSRHLTNPGVDYWQAMK